MKRKLRIGLTFASTLVLAGALTAPGTSIAQPPLDPQGGGGALVINPGGAKNADGTDGLTLVVNGPEELGSGATYSSEGSDYPIAVSTPGSDQLVFANLPQWCCGTGSGPALLIDGVLYGNAGAASSGTGIWDTISVVTKTGSAIEVPNADVGPWTSTATGDATATVRYEVTVNGNLYRVDREISYTYPNNWYIENWVVTIPAGNTAPVKFYLGGDTAPGAADSGTAQKKTSGGLDSYYIKEPNSDFYVAYIELDPASKFDGAWFATYDEPLDNIGLGEDLGFIVDDTVNPPDDTGYIEGYDVGQYIQWNLGSTAGTFTRTMRTEVGFVSVLDAPVVAPPTELPRTGGDMLPTYIAIAAMVAGASALAVSRRSRVRA